MALDTLEQRAAPRPRIVYALVAATALAVVLIGFAVAVALLSKPGLARSRTALARVELPVFAGSLVSARAYAPDGARIALRDRGGELTPLSKLVPGELVTVDVVVRSPGWLSWALGRTHRERLSVRAPIAAVRRPWLTLSPGAPLRLSLSEAVSRVSSATRFTRRGDTLIFGPRRARAGSLRLRLAARSWERLGPAQTVSWFPPSHGAVVVASPSPSASVRPTGALRLTFSQPVSQAVGSEFPKLDPAVAGSWSEPDSHTLVFTPAGTGFALASSLGVVLPRALVIGASGTSSDTIDYTVAGGTTLRLQQLLAQLGYLPVNWSGGAVARTPQAETAAAISPPAGSFNWRYANTPATLQALWSPGQANLITKGAVMMFEQEHGLAIDGIAGPEVWRTLLHAAIDDQLHTAPYSYVYVHALVPESLTLWSAGHVVLRSPGNTGIPARPTQAGTFTVFEHIPVGTMSGTNPDGTHYHDPGIRYISYFNGGDAIHEYPRASYGTPQSLGCVELPLAAAAKVWPYTPVGTLVTIVD